MTGYRCPYCGETIKLPQAHLARIEIFLKTFAECGHNQIVTAEKLGVSARSVRLWCKELRLVGVSPPKRASLRATLWTPEDEERMITLCREGKTYAEIGAIIGRTKDAVNTKRSRRTRKRIAKRKVIANG